MALPARSGVRGYVLAGGESARMQAGGVIGDKALLLLEGETLVERALRKVAAVCGETSVLGGPAHRCERLRCFGRVVEDRIGAAGPLAGVAAALEDAAGCEWLLIVAVDAPFLPERALRLLLERAMDDGAAGCPGVLVFRSEGFVQPLPALLHRGVRDVVLEALQTGERRLLPVLRRAAERVCPAGLTVVEVPAFESGGFDADGARWFVNVNTPDDLRSAREAALVGEGLSSNDFGRGASE